MISKTYRLLASIAVGIFLGAMAVFNTVDRDNRLYRENPLPSLLGSVIPSIGAAIVTYWYLGRGGNKSPSATPAHVHEANETAIEAEKNVDSDNARNQEPRPKRLYELLGFKRLAFAISGGALFVTYVALIVGGRHVSAAEIFIAFPFCSLSCGFGIFLLIRIIYWVADGFRLHKPTTPDRQAN